MDEDLKKKVLNDLEGALGMLGQAQSALHPSLTLFKELGKQYDELDSIKESMEAGDYDI